jgi:hypothetical protein
MSKNSDASNVSRRRFLAVAGTVAAASSLAAGNNVESVQASPERATAFHYRVTIDVTKNPICYTAKNQDTLANVPMPNNSITVNVGDEVKWQAITSGTHPRHRATIRFTTPSPFNAPEFKWSENGFGGGVTQTPGNFYYCVGVFDQLKGEVYADDPKIIVGGPVTAKAKVEEAVSELREVRGQVESIEDLLRKTIPQLE